MELIIVSDTIIPEFDIFSHLIPGGSSLQKTITFEDDGRFIYCKYTGRFDVKPLIDLAAEVNGHVNSKQSQAVLVDITDSHGFMETYQRFQHGHEDKIQGWGICGCGS